jgi:hypothetical protein
VLDHRTNVLNDEFVTHFRLSPNIRPKIACAEADIVSWLHLSLHVVSGCVGKRGWCRDVHDRARLSAARPPPRAQPHPYRGRHQDREGRPPEASQVLQTRQHQINEVAREFNLPPTLIGGNLEGGLTYANSLAESQRLVDQCLIPWATLWEQELDRKLLTTAERVTLYFEISFESLLRGDTTTRYGAYKTALEAGFMTVNEVRARENLPALPEAALPSAPTNGNRPRSRPDGADHAVISEALARVLRRWGADFLRATSAADVRVQLARLAGGDEADGHTRKVLETALALVPSADPASVARALRAECVRQIQQVLDTTAAQYVPGRVVQLLDKEWPVRAGALAAEIIQNGGTHD